MSEQANATLERPSAKASAGVGNVPIIVDEDAEDFIRLHRLQDEYEVAIKRLIDMFDPEAVTVTETRAPEDEVGRLVLNVKVDMERKVFRETVKDFYEPFLKQTSPFFLLSIVQHDV